jgi:hypothetical protein
VPRNDKEAQRQVGNRLNYSAVDAERNHGLRRFPENSSA